MRVYGADWLENKHSLCTMLESTDYCNLPGYYGAKWPKLQELHQFLFGRGFDGAHDSSADVAATVRCFWELRRREMILIRQFGETL